MFEKDYILRLLVQFFDDLSIFISKKREPNYQERIIHLCNVYIGDYAIFYTAETNVVLSLFEQYPLEERLYRMEMLAELYMQDAQINANAEDVQCLWRKSLSLWEYINKNSTTYSMDRLSKIEYIKSKQNSIRYY